MSGTLDILPPNASVVVSRKDLANLIDAAAALADWCDACALGAAPALVSLDYEQIAVRLRAAIRRVAP